ncbi:major facilitator superfamily domain-containing 7-a-like [Paramuricea clavata]|uniref:Major facilitator superfamily domain-containing 7-a-like n=1 Tax=Paramuricea clavata TaxID=317549 RepID=A0A7D9DU14_PARCT|nr:major facilitator superfamily domain-containing 7-a-like [Paramuricea clavata]
MDNTPLLLPSTNGNMYRVYKKRWFMLAVLTLLNFSNGMLWITFAPIDDSSSTYYGVSSFTINWLSLVFPLAALPFAMVSAWFIDTYGLRKGIILAAWLNGLGSVIRVCSTIHHMTNTERFAVVLVGQSLAAIAQTLLLPLPPKLAALWFGESQRVLANMICSTSNTVGILVANILAPCIVKSYKDIPILLSIFTGPGALAMVLATAGVTTSRPPTPPAPSAAQDSETFFKGLKQALKSKPFLVLMVCFGTGIGMFSALTTLLEQIICVHNYSDKAAGNMSALAIAFGFIGAGLVSVYVDKTKKFEIAAKICYAMATLFVLFFALISKYENKPILLGFSVSGFGFFALALLPVGLELGVECTYPVAEATSAALLWLFGQITMILIILVAGALGTKNKGKQMSCKSGNDDMTHATYFMAVLTVVIALVFIVLFRPKYLRMEAERRERFIESADHKFDDNDDN